MKRRLLLILMIVHATLILLAQNKRNQPIANTVNNKIVIRGYVFNPKTNDSVTLQVWYHYFDDIRSSVFKSKEMVYHITRSFSESTSQLFEFVVDSIPGPVYINLYHTRKTANFTRGMPIIRPFLDRYLAEPGDSITIMNFGTIYTSFYGNGSGKYQCRFDMDNKTLFSRNYTYYNADSTGQFSILQQYKNKMSAVAFEILKADILGQVFLGKYIKTVDSKYGSAITGSGAKRVVQRSGFPPQVIIYPEDRIERYKVFSKNYFSINKVRPEDLTIKNENLAISRYYPTMLLEKILIDWRILSMDKRGGIIFENILQYEGRLRDKMIVQYLDEAGKSLKGIDSLLSLSIELVKNEDYKNILRYKLNNLVKGRPAYNFELRDESGKIVGLKDFLGKVVFIDFWFTGCKPCSEYFEAEVSRAEEHFKADSNVVFISISADTDASRWMNSIAGGGYTSHGSNVVNLNTKGKDHPIFNHYNITGYPKPLLIGKNGMIFSNRDWDLRGDMGKSLINSISRALQE